MTQVSHPSQKIPKLRFREFQGEWEEKKIGDLCGIFKSGSWITAERITKNWEFPVYGWNWLRWYTNSYTHDGFYILIWRQWALCGNIKSSFGKAYISEHAIAVQENDISDTQWLGYRLDYLDLNRFSEAAAQPGLAVNKIIKLKLFAPSKSEQQKIALFLSSVDTHIEQLREKKSLLEEYKRWVMQKIFARDIRFKDENGKEYAEWEEKKLGEVSLIIMWQSPDSSSYNIENIGLGLIQWNADIKNRKSNPRNWTSESKKECKIGDLILTVRAPVWTIAKSIHNASIGRGVCAIRNNASNDIEFLYQFLLDFESKWWNLEQWSTFTAVNTSDIKNLRIKMPSLPEQIKIASFLSEIDTKIQSITEQLKEAEKWKKGLLQGMFV